MKKIMDIIDYITWRGDLTFSHAPFCSIDALILSQLSYLDFSNLVSNDYNPVFLKDLALMFKSSPNFQKRCELGALINVRTVDLLFYAAKSARFCNIEVFSYYERESDIESEQFCAVSFLLDKRTTFIAFRGTDDTLAGWKEDFLLATGDVIPAQKDSADYLENILKTTHGDIFLGGHSKGGNLAIYSAMCTQKKSNGRIKKIYNMDGPGFLKKVINGADFQKILPLISNIQPEGSIIGLMFFNARATEIVVSNNKGLMQHDPFSWEVLGNDFVTKEKFSRSSVVFHETFNEWIGHCTGEDLTVLVDTLFGIIEETGARTNSDLEKNALPAAMKILKAASKIDRDTRAVLLAILKALREPINLAIKSYIKRAE